MLALGKIADREPNPRIGLAIGTGMVACVLGIAWRIVSWFDIGRCFLGLILLYLMWYVTATVRDRSRRPNPVVSLRILFAVLAAALMARMVLNGRIYQYGFYQAAMAGTVVTAVLLGESAGWVSVERRGRRVIMTGFLALLSTGMVMLTAASQRVWRLKTCAVGQGADRFYTFPQP